MKISEVKSNLQIIMTNINQLQTHRDNLNENNSASDIINISKCRQRLEEAFARFEVEPIHRVAAQLKQRRTKRAHHTRKLKLKKIRQKSSSSYVLPSNPTLPEQQPLTTLKKKEQRTAKKYLSFMDSLETLHQLKGGSDTCKLKESLKQIRSIWHSTAQKINTEEQNLNSIETQWDQVLFGRNADIVIKCGLRDFIERRAVWDSYLVSEGDSTGSRIPIGWVCPKEDARPEWKQFETSL